MNIAGFNLNMPSINIAGTMQTVSLWAVTGIIVIALGIWIYSTIKNKAIYKYPITLRVRRENGTKVRFDLLGGIVSGKSGIKSFMIKIPRVRKKFDLGYIPDFSKADSSDRLSFLQEGDATLWQQTKEELILEKTIVNEKGEKVGVYTLLIEPIPTDIKTATYNNLQSVRELMDAKKLTAWGISILAFVVMVVAHLISLYVQTKIKCGVA